VEEEREKQRRRVGREEEKRAASLLGKFAGPFLGLFPELCGMLLHHLADFDFDRVVSLRFGEELAEGQNNILHLVLRTPFVRIDDGKADGAVLLAHVGVEDLSDSSHLGSLERILGRDFKGKDELTVGIRGFFRSSDGATPVQDAAVNKTDRKPTLRLGSNHIELSSDPSSHFLRTSCSIFKLVTEAIEGQPESMPIPKWQGIEGLKSIIKQMSDAVTTATDTANTEFTEAQNELDESVEEWEELIEHDDVNDIKDLTFDYDDHVCSTSPGTDVFLDITPYFIKEYGPVTQENTQLYYANKQFEEVTKNARESIKDASEKMEKALKDGVATQLNDAQTKIDDLGSKFDDISEKFADKWLEYGDKVDIHGKKYVKIAFSIIMGLCAILLALIIINCLMCCPCSCLVRILIHVLWNILYLLSIISFLLGTLTGLLGIIGKDGSSIVHYVISKKNLESEKPLLIGEGETTNYINTCINGDGNLKEAFDIGEIMDNLDDLYQIKDTIAEYKKTIKNNNTLFTIDYVQHFKDGKDILPMAYYQKADDGSFQDFDKISAAYSTLNLQTKNNSAEKLNDYWAFKEESTNGYIYKPKPEDLDDFHDKANVKPFLLSLNDDWKFDEMEIIYSNFGVKTRIKNCMEALNGVQDGVKSLFFDTTNTPPTSTILTNFNNRLTNKYKEVLTTIYDALDVTSQVIDPLYNVLNEYLGDDGSIYDILNCNFIGNNIKVLLSEMYGGFGKNFYSFGFIMGIIGLLSIIGIYCTILTISIGNTLRKQNYDKKESRAVESTAHEGESESKFVMKENR